MAFVMCGPGRGHMVEEDGSFECEPCDRDSRLVAKVEFTGGELIAVCDALDSLEKAIDEGHKPWEELESCSEEDYRYALYWATEAVWNEMTSIARQIKEMEENQA